MLQIKFDYDCPLVTEIFMFESVGGGTDGRAPARVPSYKLTLWAFGSGELKINH